jgi:putative flippase GtrA
MNKNIHVLSKQFIKFAVVGTLNTLISYGVYYLLLFLGIHYLISVLLSFAAGVSFGFTFNKIWVFRSAQSSGKELPKYLAVYLSGLLINLLMLPVFVEIFHIDPKIAQLFFLLFLPIYSFIGLKYWSFS